MPHPGVQAMTSSIAHSECSPDFGKSRKGQSSKLARRFSSPARRGVATTEFAICLPILLIFLFGCHETSRAFMMQHAAESAAYEAARAGIVPNATPAECRRVAENILRSVGVTNFNLNVTPNPIQQQSPTINVTIEVPMSRNTALTPFFFREVTLRGSCQMPRETF